MSSLEWMAWLPGTAAFVVAVFVALAGLVVVSVRWPSIPRQGFLRIETARGDRIYISLLGIGLIMIIYVAYTELPLPYGLAVAIVAWAVPVMRWG